MIYNLGSLNIDRVFRVPRIARPGETIAGTSSAVFAGGKGANQSVALARAGASVAHIGQIGLDGTWLRDKLAAENVDVRWIRVGGVATGEALIQVDDAGENAIVLFAGANHQITPDEIDAARSTPFFARNQERLRLGASRHAQISYFFEAGKSRARKCLRRRRARPSSQRRRFFATSNCRRNQGPRKGVRFRPLLKHPDGDRRAQWRLHSPPASANMQPIGCTSTAEVPHERLEHGSD